MCRLIESIAIQNGKALKLPYHEIRMNNSRKILFDANNDLVIRNLTVPLPYQKGKYKCRIIYGQEIEEITYIPYQERNFHRFVIEEADFDYKYKFLNRDAINDYKNKYPKTVEVIFTKKGMICDSSFSNLIFKNIQTKCWETPNTYLLNGVQRQYLLHQNMITEKKISIDDLRGYSHFMMINALLEFDENRIYPIGFIDL